MAEQRVDLVVIGAGVAGLSAAATAASRGLQVLVFEQLMPGGQIATVERVRNFPGFPGGIGGYEIGPLLLDQAEAAGAEFLLDSVTGIEKEGAGYRVVGTEHIVITAAILLAMGSSRRTLDVPGEADFEGRGVSHCASCDGHFFRGKAVVVAGGGDSAFDEAEVLAEHAAQVTIMHPGTQRSVQKIIFERVSALPNVKISENSKITALEGDGGLEHIAIETPNGSRVENASGLFVNIGLRPNSDMVSHLVEIDSEGHVVANGSFQARCPGIFVAGDLRSGATALLASVAGDGASAAVAATAYVKAKSEAG